MILKEAYVIAYYDGDEEVRILSNFAHTPFELDGNIYQTVEGFWQSLKFEDPIYRDKIKMLISGRDARQAGRFGGSSSQLFTYENKLYRVASESHHILLDRALRAKTVQNENVKTALLSTADYDFKHMTRNKFGQWRSGDSPALPAIIFERMWKTIRDELRNGNFKETLPLPPAIND